MSAIYAIVALKRNELGKVTNKFRKQGKIPANLHDRNNAAIPLWLNEKEIKKIVSDKVVETIINLDGDNEKMERAIIKHIQKNPVTGAIIHADLYVINEDKKTQWHMSKKREKIKKEP